jgi:Fe-S cluster biogenesis protein NfuA
LTVTVDTGGHVDSASGPCRSTCAFESAVGTSFTEAAVPDAGFVFAGWDGVCASQGATCVTPATGDGTAAAHFVPAHTLKISTSGDGTGTVLCAGAACGTAFAVGTHVTLTATAGTGSAFVGWKGDCSGSSATCSVTLDSDRSVQATFVKTRGVNVTIGGSGSVSGADGAIDCPTTCAATLPEGTALLLTATPATGWAFRTWTGACTGTGTCSLSIASDVAVRAAFDPVVTVRTTHRGDARVVSSPGGIDCGRVCAHAFVRGRVVVLRAKDGKTSVFDHWSGACRGTRPACRVATLGPRTAVAVFRKR